MTFFVLTDEEGNVLAKSASGAADLARGYVLGERAAEQQLAKALISGEKPAPKGEGEDIPKGKPQEGAKPGSEAAAVDAAQAKEGEGGKPPLDGATDLGDRPDFKGMLGDLQEGEQHHFQNAKYAAEKFGVERKGDKFHFTGVAAKFGDHPEEGYSHGQMAKKLDHLHGHMGEKLIHAGKAPGPQRDQRNGGMAEEEGKAPDDRGRPMMKALFAKIEEAAAALG